MCGRFTLTSDIKEMQQRFGASAKFDHHTSYNIAPSRDIPVVRESASGREIVPCRWGLVPHWSRPGSSYKAINARAETLAHKPFFRDAYRKRRCLIPANGFYEWKRENRLKQPYYFHLHDALIAFAGLWEYWEGKDERLETCTIITTAANVIMQPVHDRMPVIISQDNYQDWLENGGEALLVPYGGEMSCHPVGTYVNNPKNDGKDLIEPALI